MAADESGGGCVASAVTGAGVVVAGSGSVVAGTVAAVDAGADATLVALGGAVVSIAAVGAELPDSESPLQAARTANPSTGTSHFTRAV